MNPEIVTATESKYITFPHDQADALREHLLSFGVPCAPPIRHGTDERAICLGSTANLGLVRYLLDRWNPTPNRPERRRSPSP
jgi:hypothetical protein